MSGGPGHDIQGKKLRQLTARLNEAGTENRADCASEDDSANHLRAFVNWKDLADDEAAHLCAGARHAHADRAD